MDGRADGSLFAAFQAHLLGINAMELAGLVLVGQLEVSGEVGIGAEGKPQIRPVGIFIHHRHGEQLRLPAFIGARELVGVFVLVVHVGDGLAPPDAVLEREKNLAVLKRQLNVVRQDELDVSVDFRRRLDTQLLLDGDRVGIQREQLNFIVNGKGVAVGEVVVEKQLRSLAAGRSRLIAVVQLPPQNQ